MLTHHVLSKAPVRNTTACPTVRMSSLNACANAGTTGSAVEEIKVSLPTDHG